NLHKVAIRNSPLNQRTLHHAPQHGRQQGFHINMIRPIAKQCFPKGSSTCAEITIMGVLS
ncbi:MULTISPECIES: hypothetical protein, partial [unclassified Legionella]|uniref:hypothetical protein n=1 Tax=unclassified Legionella TaxID=2622702 RepID=UPI003AF66EDE